MTRVPSLPVKYAYGGNAALLFFQADAFYRAFINCFLYQLCGSPMRFMYLRYAVVIDMKHIGAYLFAHAASGTLILINVWYSCHVKPAVKSSSISLSCYYKNHAIF